MSQEREEDNKRERLRERFYRGKRGYERERREKEGGREREHLSPFFNRFSFLFF